LSATRRAGKRKRNIKNADSFNVIVGASHFEGDAKEALVSPPFEFETQVIRSI
jgi:hypothetical protein